MKYLRLQRRQRSARTVDGGGESTGPLAGLVTIGGVAGGQQAHRGVLVEFGCHGGDSIVAGDGAGCQQIGGHRRR
ncbi:Uncharacterised protein [Mycobacterium tuberculosis]|nr:Uncharacterised protein [Mycobacterium tuberculosis]CPB65083.1 Uncharacterised protein [Mycobacterium tuberculosis]